MTIPEPMLQNILENPADDGIRLVCADWLEEHGACDRAEFIRVECELASQVPVKGHTLAVRDDGSATLFCTNLNCENCKLRRRAAELLAANESEWVRQELGWVFAWHQINPDSQIKFHWHRGFVSQVECRLADWCGEACRRCMGEGVIGRYSDLALPPLCPNCHGTGRTPGLGAMLLRRAPIELLVVTDKEPYYSHGAQRRDRFSWHDINRTFSSGNHPESDLPTDIFDALQPEEVEHGGKIYPSADAANAALSAALIKLAREQMEPKEVEHASQR